MENLNQADAIEVVRLLVGMYAKQAAILQLIQESGVSQAKIDERLKAAEARLQKIAQVREALAIGRLPQMRLLSSTLKSIEWNQWG